MNILFRCDSSQKIGLGHLNRCLLLAKKLNGKIYFATREIKGSQNEKIEKEGFKRVALKSNDFEELKQIIFKNNIKIVIFDHYEIDKYFEKKVKDLGVKTVAFDDIYKEHSTDIVINPNFGAKNRYKQKTLFLAPLVREEFFKSKKRYRKKLKNILICFGGSDPKNLSFKIAKKFKKKYKISIITTKSNKNIKKLKSLKGIKLYIEYKNIAKLFLKNDFAILSSSTIATEALVFKMPFMVLKTTDNQKELFKFFRQKRFLTAKRESYIKINLKKYKNSIKRVKIFKYKRGQIDLFKEFYKS